MKYSFNSENLASVCDPSCRLSSKYTMMYNVAMFIPYLPHHPLWTFMNNANCADKFYPDLSSFVAILRYLQGDGQTDWFRR
jgi:hypothetical protein